MDEPPIYREAVTAVLIALSDIVAALRDFRGGLFGEEEEKSELDEAFWDRALENAQRLRQLAIENQRRHDEAKKKRATAG